LIGSKDSDPLIGSKDFDPLVGDRGSSRDRDPDRQEQMLRLHMLAVNRLSRAALQLMRPARCSLKHIGGPTAGTKSADPLGCGVRVLVHLPDTDHVTTRYDGWSANRSRGMRTGGSGLSRRTVARTSTDPDWISRPDARLLISATGRVSCENRHASPVRFSPESAQVPLRHRRPSSVSR